jgi:hypothetical protein
MPLNLDVRRWLRAFSIIAVALSACALLVALPDATPAFAQDKAIAPEKNPPGDIPDNQVFIDYRSPLGFSIKVPEGWARREMPNGVIFSDKYNTVEVTVVSQPDSPTESSIKKEQLGELQTAGRAVEVSAVKSAKLPSGSAVVASYASNSEPNPVTNKAIRLENARYFFWKEGKLATLTLSSPFGADNADQWLLMANSFRWK